MDVAGKVFWSFQFAFHECLIDYDLGGDVREFTSLPHLHLFSLGFKVPLHAVNAHGDAIDERERLRVFCEHRCKHGWDNVSEPLIFRPFRTPIEGWDPASASIECLVR
jgi:hypothetical protein